jgi:hypothetical protein
VQSRRKIFLASFLVLFLELVLIRWLPSYVRLLSYFSNFILLASFLGIGLGCLLAGRRTRLFAAFPFIQLAIVLAVYFFRLEVATPSASTIYFSSGTTDPVVVVESTLLLPLIFLVVVALFTAVAQRMGQEMAAHPPLRAYTANIAGSLTGVGAFALMSWLELSPPYWFAIVAASAAPLLMARRPDGRSPVWTSVAAGLAALMLCVGISGLMARGSIWSPYYKLTVRQEAADTVIEVNNIFHQSMAPLRRRNTSINGPTRLRRHIQERARSRRRFRH